MEACFLLHNNFIHMPDFGNVAGLVTWCVPTGLMDEKNRVMIGVSVRSCTPWCLNRALVQTVDVDGVT